MRKQWIGDVYRLAAKALASGATRKGATEIYWDISGDCQQPFTTLYWGRPPAKLFEKRVTITRDGPIPMGVYITTACHKCETCLKHRAQLWTARGAQEISNSVRTWFGTLTLDPQQAFEALTRARLRERAQGIVLEDLPPDEQWKCWVDQIQPELTKYVKRVRMEAIRQAGFRDIAGLKPIRYLLVVEAHKSGVPHFHMLVHETSPAIPVRKRTLDNQYTLGLIRQWRLVDDHKPATYVAKYLAKDARARVRASQHYGVAPSGRYLILDKN